MAAVLFVLLAMVSCQGQAPQAEAPAQGQSAPEQNQPSQPEGAPQAQGEPQPPAPETAPAASEPKTQEQIEVDWQAGPHSSTYVLTAEGTNSSCARCHAPANWTPSMDEMPESCYACKFEIKPPPPLVEEAAWEHVACKVCHQVKKGKVQKEIGWLEIPPIEEYSQIATNAELCLKCHVTDETPGHEGVVVAGAHVEMSCTDCHDAHTMTASCATSGCHTEMEAATAPIPGHDADHENVACEACHDAAAMEIGPDADGVWNVLKTDKEGEPGEPTSSHNTVKEAPCERCHYSDNPWGLSVETASSAP